MIAVGEGSVDFTRKTMEWGLRIALAGDRDPQRRCSLERLSEGAVTCAGKLECAIKWEYTCDS